MTDPIAATTTAPAPAAPPAGVAAADAARAPTPSDRGVAEADFETFLQLLTAQMRNQDPLQPMDSTEFVAQLASFSSVEQQIQANERLDAIVASLAAGADAGLAAWIGLEAETAAAVRHGGGPVALAVAPPGGAERAVLRVLDGGGAVLGATPVDPRATQLRWDGTLDGAPAAPGVRRFEVAYEAGDAPLATVEARRTVRIADLRPSPEGARFGLEGGGEAPPGALSLVRPPAEG